MKRTALFWTALLLLCLSACGARGFVYDVERGGGTYTVDTKQGTVTYGEVVCGYDIQGDKIEITYPDGSTYWWKSSGNVSFGGGNDQYAGKDGRVSGRALVEVLRPGAASSISAGRVVVGLLVAATGLLGALSPRSAWYVAYGWRYKNAEPSDAALVLQRVGGVGLILAGVFIFFLP